MKNKIRNPFPNIGKVIKYEFKHSARVLIPLYAVLLLLGLLTGLSINKKNYESLVSQINQNGSGMYSADIANILLTTFLAFAIFAFITAITIVTIVIIAGRFKRSMNGEEAYLNLSLPVTMGEHLWGKFIMYALWAVICQAAIICTGLLCCVRVGFPNIMNLINDAMPEIKLSLARQNLTFGGIIAAYYFYYLTWNCFIITMIFAVNGLSIVFKYNKGFLKFLVVVVLLWLNLKTLKIIPSWNLMQDGVSGMVKIWLYSSLVEFLWSVLFFGFSHWVYAKKLNLE
ncbi:MAG: hypothetical protein IKX23_09360 [Treponema sp.]|nr:hypothetical protein [Treponema sp.]